MLTSASRRPLSSQRAPQLLSHSVYVYRALLLVPLATSTCPKMYLQSPLLNPLCLVTSAIHHGTLLLITGT